MPMTAVKSSAAPEAKQIARILSLAIFVLLIA
jgi:hypothetical protein